MSSPIDAVDDLESRGLDVVNHRDPEWPLTVEARSQHAVEEAIGYDYRITNTLETADGQPHFYDLRPL